MSSIYYLLAHLLRSCMTLLHKVYSYFRSYFATAQIVTFDNSHSVRVGKQIAEGGFSYVFEACDADPPRQNGGSASRRGQQQQQNPPNGGRRKYALKRIICPDSTTVTSCREEAGVHRLLSPHPNLMPLLGLKFTQVDKARTAVCYMLFPLVPNSLRNEITKRKLLDETVPPREKRPWTERALLEIYVQIVDGVSHIHSMNLSHRDVKLENVLLDTDEHGAKPILMDFGSAGPITHDLETRNDVLEITEEASSNTTLPYRPPELFDGGLRHGESELNYGKVDVWSLGCVLFGMMHGASPFEMEFRKDGSARVVECSHLRVLGKIPRPPSLGGVDGGGGYSDDLFAAVVWMCNPNRSERPSVSDVRKRMEGLLEKCGGRRRRQQHTLRGEEGGEEENTFDSLLNSRDYV